MKKREKSFSILRVHYTVKGEFHEFLGVHFTIKREFYVFLSVNYTIKGELHEVHLASRQLQCEYL